MNLNCYPSGEFVVRRSLDVYALSVVSRPLSVRLRAVGLDDFIDESVYFSMRWTPEELKVYFINRISKSAFGLVKDEYIMSRKFVMNNLTPEQLNSLDSDYPSIETVEAWLAEACSGDGSVAVRVNKDGGYVAYVNQGDYAVSGRSSVPLDALVLALYKASLLKFKLSSGNTSSTTSRG